MSGMNKVLGLCLCFLMGLSTAHAQALTISSDQRQFTIPLAANPTTGYQWSIVTYDKQLFTLKNATYQSPKTKLIGAGGTMLFTFALNKGQSYPKTTKMVFNYARSWEQGKGTVKTVTLNFSAPTAVETNPGT